MKRGLTLGKYAPLHRGHQLVIETALSEMDETIAVIYHAPETTEIPLAVRSGWLRSLYPSLRVVEAWDGPTEVGYTPELMRAHERYLTERLDLGRITHFYSSELYGEHMSRALDACDRRVDEVRARVPVWGRDIRRDAYAHRRYVSARVYRDLITNVVFLGAPGTGKSTIAENLARAFQTRWMPEYGRAYWQRHHQDRRLDPKQLVEIAEGHLEREDALLAQANRYLFTDTNALSTLTFARQYHCAPSPRLAELAELAVTRYDLVFVCDTDIPCPETSDRSGEVARSLFQQQVIGDLRQRKVPYLMLRGTLDERIARVRAVLGRFRKYMNPLELVVSCD